MSFTYTVSDIADAAPTVTVSQASGSTFALGTTLVTVTATDHSGNTSSATFHVKVVDTTKPAITVPADITVEATSTRGAPVSFTYTVSDIADAAPTVTVSQASGSTFALGTTLVTVTATDHSGNTSSATFHVKVVDTTKPAITVPADITVEATSTSGAPVSFTYTVSDIADAAPTVTVSQASGSTFALGTTLVTVTATDHSGNTSSATFRVKVVDTTKPVITVPADITVEATSPGGAAVSFSYSVSDVADAAPTVTVSQASGSTFALGTTLVTITATDHSGNTTSATFHVRVVDTTAPAGSISLNGGAAVTAVPTVTVALAFTDAVGPTQMRLSTDGGLTWGAWVSYATTATVTLSGGDGLKTVTAQVRDAAGNVGVATRSITLSTAPPAITVTGLPIGGMCDLCNTFTIHYSASSVVGVTTISATLDGASLANGATIDPFLLTAGAHVIVVTATDQYGKTSTSTMQFEVHATIEGLICAVQRAVALGLVAPETENDLMAKLNAAKASRDRGNSTPEVNQLQALINATQAQRGKKINTAFADRFSGWTQDLTVRIQAGKA